MSWFTFLLILYSIIVLISEVNHMKKRNACNRVIASRDAEKVALCRKQFQNENNISDDIYNHAISVISNVLDIKIKEKLTPEDQIQNGDIYMSTAFFGRRYRVYPIRFEY